MLYILFINLASAHHLLVDPGVSATWKIWNTSYAMYLAVLASMIHGFTVPASVEVAMRGKGFQRGLFGWLANAPWGNPGFSGFFLSLVIFGFGGGITGVVLGTQQINIMAHNTLRIPGHFHVTVVGGTTLAFMALTYYVVPLIFQREFYARALCRLQPWLFGIGITTMAIGMSFAGSYGVPRRHWDVEFSGAPVRDRLRLRRARDARTAGDRRDRSPFIGLLALSSGSWSRRSSSAARTRASAMDAVARRARRPREPARTASGHDEEHHTPGTLVLRGGLPAVVRGLLLRELDVAVGRLARSVARRARGGRESWKAWRTRQRTRDSARRRDASSQAAGFRASR